LALTPYSLRRLKWIFPSWFLIINLFLFSGLWRYNIFGMPLIYILLTQITWIFAVVYFIIAREQGLVKLHSPDWVLWCAFRLMGAHFLFLLHAHSLPQEFLLRAGVIEVLVGLGAFPVHFMMRKKTRGHVQVLLFWNTLGMLSAWNINTAVQKLYFSGPRNPGGIDILSYFSRFPEIWLISFWIPLSICIHSVLFYLFFTARPLRRET
jgi:hypothetical protein